MNYPTGMGTATGQHYYNVAAQIHAYANDHYRGYTYHFYSYFPDRNFGSEIFQYTAQRLGIHPLVANEIEGVARSVLHNVRL